MKSSYNKSNKIGDEVKNSIPEGSKVPIIVPYFSIDAFKRLKKN